MGRTIIVLLLILAAVMLLMVFFGVFRILQQTRNRVRSMRSMAKMITNMTESAVSAAAERPKSVSGATQIYMRNIHRDYPEFHLSEAQAAIKTFVREYLLYKYRAAENFEISRVDEFLTESVERTDTPTAVKEIKVHDIAVCGYKKSKYYATVLFQVSYGYTLATRVETKADISYTLRLTDRQTGLETLRCKTCGAPLDTEGGTQCEYCGADVMMDTIVSWQITDILERAGS
ncbi:MAG: hypothetical protein ACK5MN_09035 [Lachnospiraceae bacterium]